MEGSQRGEVYFLDHLREQVLPAAGKFDVSRTQPVQAAHPEHGLPFADLSPGRDQAHFADGLSEELLNTLGRLPGLRVIGRTSSFSFKDRNEDVRKIGAALGVGHVLEDSVRREGERLRITAQLVDTSNGAQQWAETYDRT
ncbi:MAG TPA: hypothetical protein VIL32_07490, partial [Steroidobacteraceae bacterium]